MNLYDIFNEIEKNKGHNEYKVKELYAKAYKQTENNLIDRHFFYNNIIDYYYKLRDKEDHALNKCIEYCNSDINIAPQVLNIMKNDEMWKSYNKEGETTFIPPRFPSFQRLAIIYDKHGEYEDAIKVCEKAISLNLTDGTQSGFEGRIERLENKIKNPPQSQKPPSKDTLKKHEKFIVTSEELVTNKPAIIQNGFMITFSKSTSKNFERALFLAEQADEFNINTHNNQEIYQATFKPENHLAFINLYELISGWKSTFIFKNGEMIDRKILGQINYCFGDKLRSNDKTFCYGASMFTENPFGCHRLMIHSGQKPWYQWIKREDNRYVYIDKESMKNQIDEKTNTFHLCPAFDYDSIINILNDLPNKIDKKSQLYTDLYSYHSYPALTVNFDIDKNTKKTNYIKPKKLKKNTPIGCSTLLILLATMMLFFIIVF